MPTYLQRGFPGFPSKHSFPLTRLPLGILLRLLILIFRSVLFHVLVQTSSCSVGFLLGFLSLGAAADSVLPSRSLQASHSLVQRWARRLDATDPAAFVHPGSTLSAVPVAQEVCRQHLDFWQETGGSSSSGRTKRNLPIEGPHFSRRETGRPVRYQEGLLPVPCSGAGHFREGLRIVHGWGWLRAGQVQFLVETHGLHQALDVWFGSSKGHLAHLGGKVHNPWSWAKLSAESEFLVRHWRKGKPFPCIYPDGVSGHLNFPKCPEHFFLGWISGSSVLLPPRLSCPCNPGICWGSCTDCAALLPCSGQKRYSRGFLNNLEAWILPLPPGVAHSHFLPASL